MTIGICGGSGSGKTTLAQQLARALGPGAIASLAQDSYYLDIDTLPETLRAESNFDHPDCIDFPLLTAHLEALRAGLAVDIPHYDFATHHQLVSTTHQPARPVVVVEGTLIFCHAPLRACLDLKIFVDTEADLRLLRRVRRDIQERGRSLESVLDQYANTVRPMHQQFVAPSQKFADLILPEQANFELITALLTRKVVEDNAPAL